MSPPEVSLETDFSKVSARKEKAKREQLQKDYFQRVKENILRMFEHKN